MSTDVQERYHEWAFGSYGCPIDAFRWVLGSHGWEIYWTIMTKRRVFLGKYYCQREWTSIYFLCIYSVRVVFIWYSLWTIEFYDVFLVLCELWDLHIYNSLSGYFKLIVCMIVLKIMNLQIIFVLYVFYACLRKNKLLLRHCSCSFK